jgi:hypothetical protein
LDFFGEFDCFLFGELDFCDDDDGAVFFIGDRSLLFFDEGLNAFVLLDVFLADAMIGWDDFVLYVCAVCS